MYPSPTLQLPLMVMSSIVIAWYGNQGRGN